MFSVHAAGGSFGRVADRCPPVLGFAVAHAKSLPSLGPASEVLEWASQFAKDRALAVDIECRRNVHPFLRIQTCSSSEGLVFLFLMLNV